MSNRIFLNFCEYALKSSENQRFSPPKFFATQKTFLNYNIMPNSWGELQVLSNLNFKQGATKYNIFTIPKHLNSRMY